jgi:hypothetical protein
MKRVDQMLNFIEFIFRREDGILTDNYFISLINHKVDQKRA